LDNFKKLIVNEIIKIKSWEAPDWHEDYGDSSLEVSLLKNLCLNVIDMGYNYKFDLDCFEEGYINVNVFKNNELFFEIHIVDIKEKKIGLFFQNGEEFYIYKIDEVKKYLN